MTPRKWTWPVVMNVSVIAAGASVISAIYSVDNTTNLMLSLASVLMFALCAVLAFITYTKMKSMDEEQDEVNCLKLKRPGVEVADQEIALKGKMPEGKMPKGKMPKV